MATDVTRLDPPAELNGNGDASLARESMHAAASRSLSEREMHAAAGTDKFSAIIEPLESRAGKRLNGPGRQLCLTAFAESPDGFRLCAVDALARALVNPLGLLVRMVRDGDHRQEAPPQPADGRLTIGDERDLEEMLAEHRPPPVLCASCRAPRPADAGTKCLCGRPWRESEAVAAGSRNRARSAERSREH